VGFEVTKISDEDVGHKTIPRSVYRQLPTDTDNGRKKEDDGEDWLNEEKNDMTGDGGTAGM